jgi:DNA helicase HerA-like ATPase
VGEALVSMLLDKGIPMPVERALIAPPRCRMGAITDEERASVRARSPFGGKYDTAVNRESAFEMLAKRAEQAAAPVTEAGKEAPASGKAAEPAPSKFEEFLWGTKRRQGAVEAAAKSATRTVANGLGRQLLRGILGGLLGGKKR